MGIVDESHKDDFSITLDGHSPNVVAKENIHVRAKVLVNLTLIGSSHNRQPTKTRLSYMRHSAAVFEDKRYDLSHKSIVDDSKSVTAVKKRKIWHLKRKSVKRAFKAYTLRPKRKSKQVCYSHGMFSLLPLPRLLSSYKMHVSKLTIRFDQVESATKCGIANRRSLCFVLFN